MHHFKQLAIETSICRGSNCFLVVPQVASETQIKIPQLISHSLRDTLEEHWATSLKGQALLTSISSDFCPPSLLLPSRDISRVFPPLHQPAADSDPSNVQFGSTGAFGRGFWQWGKATQHPK